MANETISRSTILVVDKTEDILKMVTTILKASGFKVLSAKDGTSAKQLASEHSGKIDILLTDIEMPGITGPQLGIDIQKLRPDTQVLLMSGLPDGALLVLDHGWAFIQKPFLIKRLVEMVNAVLEHPGKPTGSYGYDTSK